MCIRDRYRTVRFSEGQRNIRRIFWIIYKKNRLVLTGFRFWQGPVFWGSTVYSFGSWISAEVEEPRKMMFVFWGTFFSRPFGRRLPAHDHESEGKCFVKTDGEGIYEGISTVVGLLLQYPNSEYFVNLFHCNTQLQGVYKIPKCQKSVWKSYKMHTVV